MKKTIFTFTTQPKKKSNKPSVSIDHGKIYQAGYPQGISERQLAYKLANNAPAQSGPATDKNSAIDLLKRNPPLIQA